MITHYFKTAEDTELQKLAEPRSGVWTHVVAPTEAELESLFEYYGVDDAIIADISDIFEIPRFEQEGATTYFFARYPFDVPDIDIDTAPILIILGETFVLTIAQQEVPFLEPFVTGKRSFHTTQKTELFLEFIAEIMHTYERKLAHMRKLVYRDMGRVRSVRSREIQRLVFLEQELNEMIAALAPTANWLNQLTKGNYIRMFADDRELLDDVLIATEQLQDSAKSILKTIQNIRSASEAILTQSLNNTIRMLTAITIILTIPTLVASLFGMNVPVPLAENPYGFWIILGVILVAVGLTMHFFSRNRWI
jgi:magnesium transporter